MAEGGQAPRRKFWGWGLEGEGLGPAEVQELGRAFAGRLGLGDLTIAAPPQISRSISPAPASPRPLRSRPSARRTPTNGRCTATASSYRDLVRGVSPRTSAPARRRVASRGTRREVSRSSTGAPKRASPRSRSAAARASSAASRPRVGDRLPGRRQRRPRPARPGARDRPRPHAPRASRAACSARPSRTSSDRTDYTLRHFPQSFEFSTPRRLDRHPLGRPLRDALHPHRRVRRGDARRDAEPACSRRGDFPARAQGRHPTGSSPAPRERSA